MTRSTGVRHLHQPGARRNGCGRAQRAGRLFVVAVLCAMATACMTTATGGDGMVGDVYHGFSLVDPIGERIHSDAWIVVRDGSIQKVGTGTPPTAASGRVFDMRGTYAMPGLIDGHAHITSGPHRITVSDGKPLVTIESVDAITRHNARTALAFGVTTVRNPGGDPEANARYDRHIASGAWIGPEAVHAGAVIQPPPFGGAAFAYPRTDAEWAAEASRQARLGMRYFKLYSGLDRTELEAGIRAAHGHGMRAIAHLDMVSWSVAAQLGINGLEHTLPTSPDLLEPAARETYLAERGPDNRYLYRWFELADFDAPRVRELLALLAERRVVVSTTLGVNELVYNADMPDAVLPPADRVYMHPDNLQAMLDFLRAGSMRADDHQRARAVMPKVLDFARRLHDAGVPILVGTDGNGGGPAYARELGLHAQAGIPAWEVLRMATSRAAALLELSHRTGRIAEGLEADVVFLRGNPAQDITNVRKVVSVMTDGRAHRFEDLTSRDADAADLMPPRNADAP